MTVLQAKMGQDTFGSAFSGAVEQLVEVLPAQQEHVLDERRLLLFGFGHGGLQKCETRLMHVAPRRVQG
jgi:surfactin synthase thioesterase subunit